MRDAVVVGGQWVVPQNMSWTEWQTRMCDAAIYQKQWAWYVGDLLNYGIEHWPAECWQFISNIKLAHETLMNYKSVAGKIPQEERNAEVPFTVYQDIAALPRPERDRIVTGYLGGSLNRADIRALKSQTNGNSASNGSDASDALPSAKEAAFLEFAHAMLTCTTLIRHRDEENLKEGLDEVIEKAMVLKGML